MFSEYASEFCIPIHIMIKFNVQGDFCMKIKNNVFLEKSELYNAII